MTQKKLVGIGLSVLTVAAGALLATYLIENTPVGDWVDGGFF